MKNTGIDATNFATAFSGETGTSKAKLPFFQGIERSNPPSPRYTLGPNMAQPADMMRLLLKHGRGGRRQTITREEVRAELDKAIDAGRGRIGEVFALLIENLKQDDLESNDRERFVASLHALIANELFIGNYGPGTEKSVTISGIEKKFDIMDLMAFSSIVIQLKDAVTIDEVWATFTGASEDKDAFHRAARALSNVCDEDKNPDEIISPNPLQGQNNYNPASYSDQDKVKAYQVLMNLPEQYSSRIENLPIHKISPNMYRSILRESMLNGDAFPELQQARDQYLTHLPAIIKSRVYTDPAIAYRYLPANSKVDLSVGDLEDKQKLTIKKDLSKEADKMNKQLNSRGLFGLMKQGAATLGFRLLEKLNDLIGFDQNAVSFRPDGNLFCFDDVECPEKTAVVIQTTNGEERYHANEIKLEGLTHQKIIAAQQPNGTENGIRNFLSLVKDQADVVIDLRNDGERDANDHAFDYTPLSDDSEIFDDIMVSMESAHELGETRKLELQLSDENSEKNTTVFQYKKWPDYGVISSKELRGLSKLLDGIDKNKSVVVHCRAGVGRTGTLLAYSSLFQQLCQDNGSKISKGELIYKVIEEVYNLRLQRGIDAVQTEDQFKLIYDTLKEDLRAMGKLDSNKNESIQLDKIIQQLLPALDDNEGHTDNKIRVNTNIDQDNSTKINVDVVVDEEREGDQSPLKNDAFWSDLQAMPSTQFDIIDSIPQRYDDVVLPKASAITGVNLVVGELNGNTPLHANELVLGNDSFVLAQSPHTHDEVWQHWHAILEKECDVLEVVSPLNPEADNAAEVTQDFGLNFIDDILIDSNSKVMIGNYEITDIEKKHRTASSGLEEVIYKISYKLESEDEVKTVSYRLIQADFDDRTLKAHDLYEIVSSLSNSEEAPLWMSSQCGVGRPSAVICTKKLMDAIRSGDISTMDEAKLFIKDIVQSGRAARGPMFLHKSEQLNEILTVAKALLEQSDDRKDTTEELFPQITVKSPTDHKRPKPGLLNNLVRWLKGTGKATDLEQVTNSLLSPIKSFQDLLAWYRSIFGKASSA